MRKQVDFTIVSRTITGMTNPNVGSMGLGDFRDYVKHTYPFSDGWEILSMESIHLNPTGLDPEGLTFVVYLVKYENDYDDGQSEI